MSPNILLVILLISLVMGLVIVGYFLIRIYKMRLHLRSLKDLKNFFNGTADNEQLNDLRTQLKILISPVDTQRFSPRPGPSTARGVPVTTTKHPQDQPPTPPARPSNSKIEIIPMTELPCNQSLQYTVTKLEDKGLDARKYRAFLQKHMPTETSFHR